MLMLNKGSTSEKQRWNIHLDHDLVHVGVKRKAGSLLGRLVRTQTAQPRLWCLVLGSPPVKPLSHWD